MLSGSVPIFSQYGNDVYSYDVVQQAINCIVTEMKKLNPLHIRESGGDVAPVASLMQSLLNSPNELMTTSEFIEKITWQLYLNYNAFIIPTYFLIETDKGIQKKYTGLYPIQPQQVDFLEDGSGKIYVKFLFGNGYESTLNYDDVIHIKYKYSVNEYMGGNNEGQPDNSALLDTLKLNAKLLGGISTAMSKSGAVNGVVKYNTLMDDGNIEKALKGMEQKLKNSESGFLPLDLKAEYIPISRDIKFVDESTLKFIDEKILRHFGVPLCILTGDYTKAQYEAFYQKTLEPIVISFSQAFSKTLFTLRERSFGNKINFYPKDLVFMSISETLEMVNLLGCTGTLYENEKRTAFGLMPLPELEGVRMQSLNWVNVEHAKEYQLGGNSNGAAGKQQD